MSKTSKVSPRFQISKDNLIEFLIALRTWDILDNQETGKILETVESSQCLPPHELPSLSKMMWVKDIGTFQPPKALWMQFLLRKDRVEDLHILRNLRFSRTAECREAGCLNPLHWRFLQKNPSAEEASHVELLLLSIILKNPFLCPAEVKDEAQKQLTQVVLGLIRKGIPIDLPALQNALKGVENETRS